MAMTALLGVSLAVVLGVAPAAQAFAPFADPIMFLFIGSFILARAIFFHGLDRRFAFALLTLPGVGPRPGRVLAALAVATFGLSMWISNTATVAMMLPIGLSLLHVLEAERPAPAFAAALLFSHLAGRSFGGLGTPVGTPPNLIGIGFIRREAGVDIPFFGWMAIGAPAGRGHARDRADVVHPPRRAPAPGSRSWKTSCGRSAARSARGRAGSATRPWPSPSRWHSG